MLTNLIESGSQTTTLKRRTSFFLITLFGYGALTMLVGAISIYAYDAQLTTENREEIQFITFPPIAAPEEPRQTPPRTPRIANTLLSVSEPRPLVRTAAVAPTSEPNKAPTTVSVLPTLVPSIPTGADYKIGGVNTSDNGVQLPTSAISGDVGVNNEGGREAMVMRRVEPPLPPVKKNTPIAAAVRMPPRRVSKGIINGEALKLPSPGYPSPARIARQSGLVPVQIIIDLQGKVVSAKAVGGPVLLRFSAERAALQAKFRPTLLSGEPVIVQGIINYQFKLE